MSILEDLTTLSPRKLEKRLRQIAEEALPCIEVWAADANRCDGLTVALLVDARSRPDVADVGRVLEDEPRALLATAWALLSEGDRSVLLLRVDVERPVRCSFAIRFQLTGHSHDPTEASLPLLLAASRFVLLTEAEPELDRPALWFATPYVRECIRKLIATAPCGA